MRILIAEDDKAMARILTTHLNENMCVTHHTDLGEECVELATYSTYDAIVLDVNLPDLDGKQVLKNLRAAGVKTPVLALTGYDDFDTKLECFRLGADDYLSKPFDLREVLARLSAVVRRAQGHTQSVISTGDLSVNLDTKLVHVGDHAVPVTCKEYQILELLSMRQGRPVSKDVILDYLYGGLDEPGQKIIEVFVCKLRKKLGRFGRADKAIRSVRGIGYKLCSQEYPAPA